MPKWIAAPLLGLALLTGCNSYGGNCGTTIVHHHTVIRRSVVHHYHYHYSRRR